MNKYQNEINDALTSYENHKPYHTKDIDWICNRIDWCYKWKKITKKDMEMFAERAIKILKEI